jgi:4-hydroxy-tetrahydrodipicolinate reductase
MLNVLVNGAQGRMGRVTVECIQAAADLRLVAGLTRSDDLALFLRQQPVDVVIDFTLPECVYANAVCMLEAGVSFVIGTSGLTAVQLQELEHRCSERSVSGLVVPNFSIAAILMMRFAEQARPYFPDVEIIECHHDQKVDAPSGTALRTEQRIQRVYNEIGRGIGDSLLPNADDKRIAIHSVRLPGLFAHQAVVFHGEGEALTIKHDANNRSSMMPGVLLACRRVSDLSGLHVGLESVLDL